MHAPACHLRTDRARGGAPARVGQEAAPGPRGAVDLATRAGGRGVGALLALLALLPPCAPAAASDAPAAPHSHTWEGLGIDVVVDPAEPEAAGGVDIAVHQAGAVITRLDARRIGRLEASWVVDLDEDGRFEVVLAFLPMDPAGRASLQVWEWQAEDLAFAPVRLPPFEGEEARDFRGGDRYLVEDGDTLVWTFPRAGDDDPVRLEYDFDDGRWETAGFSPFW